MEEIVLIDHNQDPPVRQVLLVPAHEANDMCLDDIKDRVCRAAGKPNNAQFVECRQNGKPIASSWSIKIYPKIPIDLKILKTWKDVVAFLLSKPKTDAFPDRRHWCGEADLEFRDLTQLIQFKHLETRTTYPFVQWIQRRNGELGQMDYASPHYSGIRGLAHREPFMKELIVSPPSQKDWDFQDRTTFVNFLRAESLFPDPLWAIVFEYAQSEFKQLIEECLILAKHGVRILVGDASWLLRQTNLLFSCGRCEQRETELLTFHSCGQCKRRKYCSFECQQAHWPVHKKDCELFVALGALAPRPPDSAKALS